MDNLVLHLTEACNMRCKYCFMPPGSRRMSEEVAVLAIDLLLASGKDYARVTYYGGEPLLEEPLLRTITECIKAKSHIAVHLGIVTNGTLINDSFLEFADEQNLKISVSYDGLKNDDNRLSGDGLALLNISRLRDAIIKYQIISSSVITPTNIGILHDNVVNLKELGFRHMNFFFDYSATWKLQHVELLRAEFARIAEKYVEWLKSGDRVYINKIDDMIACYASDFGLSKTKVQRDMAFSIAVDGNVYPYASAVGNKNLCLGNVTTEINWDKVNKVTNLGFVRGCETCVINTACVSAIGNIITDDLLPYAYPIACHGYKTSFDTADWIINKLLDEKLPLVP
ncbi:MAG: radical SAM protein [Coriobacteriia bacterium]|nr:radical SAM protein [Coriobacteriia bacterium]MCL2749513.1 radical SAM protein [Coriobacteriia bacterium]